MPEPLPTIELGPWERYLSEPVRGRKVICAFEVLAAMTRLVTRLRRWGAEPPLLVPDGIGTGPLPLETDAEVHLVQVPPVDSLTEQVRARMDLTRYLTPDLVEVIERYDPDGTAWWWLGPPSPNTELLGRPVLGGRPARQAELEDKLRLDELLRAVDAPRIPAVDVPATFDALEEASARLRAETGAHDVVWAGDARDGINGGGDYVRWVRTREQAGESAQFFAAHCDLVRVTPFVDGVPCSIHGIVLPDGVVVLRPVELGSLRDAAAGRFRYAGMGTTYDPPASDTDAMRDLARRLGGHLRRRFDYRGGFSIDGVLGASGFRATEINPRFSGGLSRLAAVTPSTHLELVQLNAVIGRDVGRGASDIEAAALAELDAHRFADAMGISRVHSPQDTTQVRVRTRAGALEPAGDVVNDGDGSVSYGPSPMGGFVRLTLDPGVAQPGERVATWAAMLHAFADEQWATGFGSTDIAPDVRS